MTENMGPRSEKNYDQLRPQLKESDTFSAVPDGNTSERQCHQVASDSSDVTLVENDFKHLEYYYHKTRK